MTGTVDAHVHLSELPGDLLIPFAKKNGLRYTLRELLTFMGENGVEQGLLLSPPGAGGRPVPNTRIVDLCEKSSGRLHPVLTVEPTRAAVADAVGLARRLKRGVMGFKILLGYYEVFATASVYNQVYDYAESEGLPVLFHTGDTATSAGSLRHAHPLTLDPLANKRPDLKMVVCHFGNPWLADTAELLYKHQNVYADISGMFTIGAKYSQRYFESLAHQLSEAIYYVGSADKVLFGTDYPVETYSPALKLARSLRLPRGDERKVLGGNARRLFPL
jgi:uncharacterized protein